MDNTDGFLYPLQIYTSSPSLKNYSSAEQVIVSLIYSAKKSIYIITPYLSLTESVENALCFASKSNIDVKIIIPGVPDKKFVYRATLFTGENLLKKGIKVYTYKSGFAHAKMIIIDDACVNISSINFDYRSFYFSFEIGVNVYSSDFAKIAKDNLDKVFAESTPVVNKNHKFSQRVLDYLSMVFRTYF